MLLQPPGSGGSVQGAEAQKDKPYVKFQPTICVGQTHPSTGFRQLAWFC